MNFTLFSVGLSFGLFLFSCASGIARIGEKSVEAMARQPDIADKIRAAMLLAAALIEGIALFGIFVCWRILGA